MKGIMKANRIYYINAGSHFYEQQQWEKAYKNFKIYADMPELPLMEGEKWPEVKDDTLTTQIKYYAAIAASAIPDHQTAIEILSKIKNDGYQENEIYQRLIYEYGIVNDSVSILTTLREGFQKFQEDNFYILSLINESIKLKKLDEAIDFLKEAIILNPNDPQLYDVLGTIYENSSEPEKAIETLDKALALDPNHAKALKHKGMVYYNLGVKSRASADSDVSDNKLYEEAYNKSVGYYKESLPLFEKSYAIDPEDKETIFCLRFVYYSLNMNEKFEELDAIYIE
jgi:tetratricopeptide (TPR) repeat protein